VKDSLCHRAIYRSTIGRLLPYSKILDELEKLAANTLAYLAPLLGILKDSFITWTPGSEKTLTGFQADLAYGLTGFNDSSPGSIRFQADPAAFNGFHPAAVTGSSVLNGFSYDSYGLTSLEAGPSRH
jgi:hypothetical protein